MPFIQDINALIEKNNDELKIVTSAIQSHIGEARLKEITTVGYPFGGADSAWPATIFKYCTHLVMFDLNEFGDFLKSADIENFKEHFGFKNNFISITPSANSQYETFDSQRFFVEYCEQFKLETFPVGYLAAIRLKIFLGCEISEVKPIHNQKGNLIATELHFDHGGVKKKLTHLNIRIGVGSDNKVATDSLLAEKISYWIKLSQEFDALLIKGAPPNLLNHDKSREIAIGDFYKRENGIVLADVKMHEKNKQQPIFNTTVYPANIKFSETADEYGKRACFFGYGQYFFVESSDKLKRPAKLNKTFLTKKEERSNNEQAFKSIENS